MSDETGRLNAVLIGFMSAGLVDAFFATGAFRAPSLQLPLSLCFACG
jgi:hypothetical protein